MLCCHYFLPKKRHPLAVCWLMIVAILALCFAKHLPIRKHLSVDTPQDIYLLANASICPTHEVIHAIFFHTSRT